MPRKRFKSIRKVKNPWKDKNNHWNFFKRKINELEGNISELNNKLINLSNKTTKTPSVTHPSSETELIELVKRMRGIKERGEEWQVILIPKQELEVNLIKGLSRSILISTLLQMEAKLKERNQLNTLIQELKQKGIDPMEELKTISERRETKETVTNESKQEIIKKRENFEDNNPFLRKNDRHLGHNIEYREEIKREWCNDCQELIFDYIIKKT